MADDFYLEAGRQRLAVLEAARTAALADLQAHKVNGDRDAAAEAVQTIANLDVEMQNLGGLYQRYQASQNPPAPPEPSPEERAARPITAWIGKMSPISRRHQNTPATSSQTIPRCSPAGRKRKGAGSGENKMFGADDRSKLEGLSAMARVSVDKSFGNKIEAAQKMQEWLSYDRRFEGYDLVDRTMLCRSNGARLDLSDPELMGGAPRPLKRSDY
jgi:hypothetical protein